MTEILNARRQSGETERRKLFPISFWIFDTIKAWECLRRGRR